jgi:superfamily II DNA or RNA helicase
MGAVNLHQERTSPEGYRSVKREENLRAALEVAKAECSRLQEENDRLRALLRSVGKDPRQEREDQSKPIRTATQESSTEAKIAVFRGMFRGREDVFALRWETKSGRVGYSLACSNEWRRPRCRKPRVMCGECENRRSLPITDEVIRDHLSGKHTVAVYPLLEDQTCWFVAAAFERAGWIEHVGAFLSTCRAMEIPAALERTRSGNGAHAWIFFERPVPAAGARKLGCAILTRTIEQGYEMSMDAYDHLFPDHDTLPRGGFGGVIPLPLQRDPRERGNSVFLGQDLLPHPDQWHFLSTHERMPAEAVDDAVREAERKGKIIGVRMSLTEEEDEQDPWTAPPSRRKPPERVEGSLPGKVRIVQQDMIYLEKEELPPAMLSRLRRLAAFQNPEYYRAQAMGLSTFDKPRVIACAEDSPTRMGLPRGCLEEVLGLLGSHRVEAELVDQRHGGAPIEVAFKGVLSPLQQEAAEALLADENGVLHAGTAFGKTVVASWLIAARGVNTLVLVHRRQLMDQWKEKLTSFLGLSPDSVGRIGGGANSRKGCIDIAVLQSLNRKGAVKDLVAEYGHVIVDECHHVPAFTFEQVLNRVRGRYVLGLTATPIRKDGHHPIVMMQCGPIRFRVDARHQAASRPFDHVVIPRQTGFRMSRGRSQTRIQDVYAALIKDQERNELILDDLVRALKEGRSPLLLTERTEHVKAFAERLQGLARHVVVLRGGMGKNQRKAVAEQIQSIPDEEERVLIATGRYIGEGFDDARLDTLFLAMPISWRGTLQQYAGRLHRRHENKSVVQIYDYVDRRVPMLTRMYDRRLDGYRTIGYRIRGAEARA